ncbi:hypothetical protein O7621_07550 [Solwaraspora sp. WMMD937]|uniref:DUF6924 domain-containing protein n=1 Tax=Solwaraspora sp. WMMD937 TaxID=3016090 RepID=UPI00249B00E4|nr:hypothetical protein [Solwaraspora sp. WMMD937]WFE23156.1 hypothetical protein O7621_07550 [Solwaraspora sp. WMMD937]
MPTRPLIVRTDDLEFEPCVVRTDFSDEAAWQQVLRRLNNDPVRSTDLPAAAVVDDPAFDGATVEEVLAAFAADDSPAVFFVADAVTMRGEQPLLAVKVPDDEDDAPDEGDEDDDGFVEPTRDQPFRLLPETVLSVHGNLTLANMDFEDYGPSDDDPTTYVYRGL